MYVRIPRQHIYKYTHIIHNTRICRDMYVRDERECVKKIVRHLPAYIPNIYTFSLCTNNR